MKLATIQKIEEMIGQKFHRLTILRIHHIDKFRSKVYECLCDCGNVSLVRHSPLKLGKIKSCGCLHKERIGAFAKANNYTKRKILIEDYTKSIGGFVTDNYSLTTASFIYKLTNLINNKIYIRTNH